MSSKELTRDEARKLYLKNLKDINRLYNTYTPLKKIRKLLHDNEQAYKNELKRLDKTAV